MDKCSQCKSSNNGSSHMISCEKCGVSIHQECLKSGRPSPIEGDNFFQFTCSSCNPSNEEQLQRMKLPWITVVHLALYNLQLEGGSKCGFFKWKEHICAYIDRHWHNFFDCDRKKSVTWHGTVAGTLSTGSPHNFTSGLNVLKQPGWWRLTVNKPPTLQSVLQFKSASAKSKTGKQSYKEPSNSVLEEPRNRSRMSSIEAAIQLKAKRDRIQETKEVKRQRLGSDYSPREFVTTGSLQKVKCNPELQVDVSCEKLSSTERKQHLYSESVSALLGTGDSDSDIEIDPCALSPLSTGPQPHNEASVPDSEPTASSHTHHENQPTQSWDQIMANLCVATVPDVENTIVIKSEAMSEEMVPQIAETVVIKQEPFPDDGGKLSDSQEVSWSSVQNEHAAVKEENTQPSYFEEIQAPGEDVGVNASTSSADPLPTTSCDTSQSETESISETDETGSCNTELSDSGRLQSKWRKRKSVQTETATHEPKERFVMLSVYEEKQLLKSLLSMENVTNNKRACRLKCKLQLREIKRQRGLACLDLDAMMNRLVVQKSQLYGLQFTPAQENFTEVKPHIPESNVGPLDVRILDRFQTHQQVHLHSSGASFLNKLVGTEDDQLQSIHSPYTSRLLKPFIRRDYETVPLKMKLLMEIQAYHHRHTSDWAPPSPLPIDYCYVRPQHIPTVNSYCREFFWPGIDMSECLHYPDFSCIAMYRKFVIGFAFMVPDVKHNEAYISFIFTHPEWRGAGIAKFMLYHLIQTCMGKDVTLHVSANNPAMLLYQKFGFKPEEFILDFYDKYFPLDSKESRHAFFLRLRR